MISRLSFTNQSATKRDDTVKKTPFSLKKKSSSKSSFAPPYNTNKFNFK